MAFQQLGDFGFNVFRTADPRVVTTERTFKRRVYFDDNVYFKRAATYNDLSMAGDTTVEDLSVEGDITAIAGGNAGRSIRGNFGAHVYSTAASQSIPTATITKVTWTTSLQDGEGTMVDLTNNRLIAPADGWYTVTGGVRWDSIGSGVAGIRYMQNGASIAINQPPAAAATTAYMNLSASVYLLKDEYIEMWAYQNSGASVNLNTGSKYEAWMIMVANF